MKKNMGPLKPQNSAPGNDLNVQLQKEIKGEEIKIQNSSLQVDPNINIEIKFGEEIKFIPTENSAYYASVIFHSLNKIKENCVKDVNQILIFYENNPIFSYISFIEYGINENSKLFYRILDGTQIGIIFVDYNTRSYLFLSFQSSDSLGSVLTEYVKTISKNTKRVKDFYFVCNGKKLN